MNLYPDRRTTPVLLLMLLAPFAGCGQSNARTFESGLIASASRPSGHAEATPALLDLGRKIYTKQCAACHGESGDGVGEAAYLLYPRPRDFTMGEFRLASTWEGTPTDEDLYRTISRGMPGSAMPSWGHLSEETRWGLVHFVKSLSKRSLTVKAARQPSSPGGSGEGVIELPREPAYGASEEARARFLFLKGCAPCHGENGKGDGVVDQKDSKGVPTKPRDLTAGVYKGSPEPGDLYRRIVGGLPGSPMPQSSYLDGEDGWHLAHFVLSLSSPEQRARVEMNRFRVVAPRVARLPEHPDSGVWNSVEAVNLHLMPLWWRPERPEEVTIKAVHDGKEIALLMAWPDGTYDHTAMRPQDFRDAAAVELSLTPDPPFFAMGQKAEPVNIWMWKSERQADMEPAFQELEKLYPNIGIDSYPNTLLSPLEQPMRHALTLQSDPTFVTAWGAGNIVADPTRGTAAEDLAASGFGTLRARPAVDRTVDAFGAYATGSYRVVFRRALAGTGESGATLKPGGSVPVAFAVWNGSAGDRDGKKSVTIWQELVLAP